MKSTFVLLGLLMAGPAPALLAQEPPPDRLSVPFSDPARPGTLKVGLVSGSITVQGYEGKEAVIEARARGGRASRSEAPAGMRRIYNTASGLTVEEEHNVMSVSVASHMRAIDVDIRVPFNTSLKLSTVNDGTIRVERVRGEVEVNNINGPVTLSNLSGSAVAHALNGKLTATFDDVAPAKAMSFSSMNGTIDVTLPANVKANVALQSDMGEIYSDFEIQMAPNTAKPVVEAREGSGKYRVRLDRTMRGTINGGGPEYQFKNFHGNIYIRKKGV